MYRNKYQLWRWDIMALARVYDWAGHIARFGNWAPSRLVWKALKFKDISYLRALEKCMAANVMGGNLRFGGGSSSL